MQDKARGRCLFVTPGPLFCHARRSPIPGVKLMERSHNIGGVVGVALLSAQWVVPLLIHLGVPSTSKAQADPAPPEQQIAQPQGDTLSPEEAPSPENTTPPNPRPAASTPGPDPTVIDPMTVAQVVTLATSAALVASGGVFFAVGQNELGDLDDVPPDVPWVDVRDDYDDGQGRATVGAALLAAGLVGTAASVAWLVSSGDDAPSAVALDLRPQAAGAALTLAGSF